MCKSYLRKPMMIGLLLCSLGVMAGVFRDISYNDRSFMNESEVKLSFRLDDNFEREVANISENLKNEKVTIKYFPVTKENQNHLNGKWNIFNYID